MALSSELKARLKEAVAAYKAMTPDEKEAMHKAQRESWIRAEMSWPKPKFKWLGGVRVYDSYEDYCND